MDEKFWDSSISCFHSFAITMLMLIFLCISCCLPVCEFLKDLYLGNPCVVIYAFFFSNFMFLVCHLMCTHQIYIPTNSKIFFFYILTIINMRGFVPTVSNLVGLKWNLMALFVYFFFYRVHLWTISENIFWSQKYDYCNSMCLKSKISMNEVHFQHKDPGKIFR